MRVQAAAVAALKLRAPRHVGRHCLKIIRITALARLRDHQCKLLRPLAAHDLLQQLRYRSKQLGQGLLRRRRQIVYAHAGHAQHGKRGRFAQLLKRCIEDRQAGAGAQRGPPAPQVAARFLALHLQLGIALRLGRVGVSVLARHIVRFKLGNLAAVLQARWHARADRLLGLVVVAEHRGERCADLALRAQGLHRILLFAGTHIVKADAAVSLAARVFRNRAQLRGVGKQHRAGAVVALFKAPRQAFFGQQAPHEVEVGLAVLAAVAALGGARHERARLVAPAPLGHRAVCREYVFDDLDHGLVLPHAAVTHLAQAPQPWRQAQAIARQPPFTTQHGHFADVAVKAGAGAVGQAHLQAGRLAQQRRQRNVGIGGNDNHVAPANALHRVVGGKGLHQQTTGAMIAAAAHRQCVQAAGTGKLRQHGGNFFGQGRHRGPYSHS